MWYLKFKTTAHKFTAIPETATCFSGHNIHGTGNEADSPANQVVNLLKLHNSIIGYVSANLPY
jgi:hypothetical protein